MKLILQILFLFFFLLVAQVALAGSSTTNENSHKDYISKKANLSKKEFHSLAFKQNINQAENKSLWLDKSLQQKINKILNHNYPKLRLRYKRFISDELQQTSWFLDEIGKEKPISFGISIINDRVDLIRVIKFRESRGGEIQMQAFEQQFNQAGLNDELFLDKNIDGISGATMSVNAMKKITRVALMLHRLVMQEVKTQ